MWNNQLQCDVLHLEYCFDRKVGILVTNADSCPDQAACTNLFEKISPDAKAIVTVVSGMPDTSYVKINGEWNARKAKSRRSNDRELE